MKSNHILGLNARNHLFQARYNSRKGKRIADSKLLTKKFLTHLKIPHPRLIAHFESVGDVSRFDWNSLADNFVVKPASGYAGEGILLIRRRIENQKVIRITGYQDNRKEKSANLLPSKPANLSSVRFELMDRSRISLDDIKLHVLDILEGRFDKYDLPGTALIEERIPKHLQFRRYAYQGTPDVRIIVFNHVPVMSFLRLPTPESKGRANISQGAIAAGIDLATGITTRAVVHDRTIMTIPDTNLRLSGIQVPFWDRMLEIAVEVQDRMGLGYMAVDFLLDPEKGPLVIELTARPGLGIQLANLAGLRRRLERVEGLDVAKDRGIEVGKALFAEAFADKIIAERGIKVVSVFETAKVRSRTGEKVDIAAKIDTGAFRSSIDETLARELGLFGNRNVLWHDTYESALGKERRPVIPITLWLSGRKIETTASVSNRGSLKYKLLIGRRDLGSYMVRPGK